MLFLKRFYVLIFVLFWFKGIHSKFELCYLSSGRGFFLNDYQLPCLSTVLLCGHGMLVYAWDTLRLPCQRVPVILLISARGALTLLDTVGAVELCSVAHT